MRHRTDSPNGIMEFLIARMAERLRDEGLADPEHAVEFMSLSAAPLAGMNPERDNAREGGVAAGEGTQVLQHALQIVADWMEPAYGFHSLFNFKRKFQPAEAPVYVCYPDPAALPQIGLAGGARLRAQRDARRSGRHAQYAAVVGCGADPDNCARG